MSRQIRTTYFIRYEIASSVVPVKVGFGIGNPAKHLQVLVEVDGPPLPKGTIAYIFADIHESEDIRENSKLFLHCPSMADIMESMDDFTESFDDENDDPMDVYTDLLCGKIIDNYCIMKVRLP